MHIEYWKCNHVRGYATRYIHIYITDHEETYTQTSLHTRQEPRGIDDMIHQVLRTVAAHNTANAYKNQNGDITTLYTASATVKHAGIQVIGLPVDVED